MSWDLIDELAGSAASNLVGHVPNVGTTAWSNAAGYMYPGSTFLLDGNGFVYQTASASLILWPGIYVGNNHVIRASMLFLTASGVDQSINLYSPASAAVDCRFGWLVGTGFWLTDGGGGVDTASVSFPAANSIYEIRLTLTDTGGVVTVLCEYSTNQGTSWTTLFGGAKTLSALATGVYPFSPGFWFDTAITSTTGVHIGNLRVGPSGTTPSLAVSPAYAVTSTNETITLTGTATGWNSGSNAPTMTVTGGTSASLSGQSLSGFSAGTVTLHPGSAPGTLTITDPAGGTATVTVEAAATAFTLTGPTAGIINFASSVFTVTPNGVTTGTFTPGAVAGCTFSPATLTWTESPLPQTFTVTKTTSGSASINGTFSNSLTPPSSITYTPVAGTVYDSIVGGFTTGLAGSITVTPRLWSGSALSTDTIAVAAPVVESDQPGMYVCRVAFPTTDLTNGVIPAVAWTVNSVEVMDWTPIPILLPTLL